MRYHPFNNPSANNTYSSQIDIFLTIAMAFYESKMLVLILRAVQAIFSIIVLGLTAYGKSNPESPTTPTY